MSISFKVRPLVSGREINAQIDATIIEEAKKNQVP